MRLYFVGIARSTAVVLLLKLGKNEVCLAQKKQPNKCSAALLSLFHNPTCL
jgi:hypothetical protein